MSIEEFEAKILSQARAGYGVSEEEEDQALSKLQKRLAAAPFVLLTGLELPPLPDPASVAAAAGHSGGAASGLAVGSQASAASATIGLGGSSTVGAGTSGFLAGLIHLTPLKLIALTAAVGGVSGATYGFVAPSDEVVVLVDDSDSEHSMSTKVGASTQGTFKSQVVSAGDTAIEEERTSAEATSLSAPHQNHAPEARKVSPGRSSQSVSEGRTVASPMDEEMSYLRKAQSALKEGNASQAWQLMLALDAKRPSGVLIPERRMTKIISLCNLGRTSEAQKIAETVLSSSSGPMYRSRLSKSCVTIEETKIGLASFPDEQRK